MKKDEFIYGIRPVAEAIKSGLEIDRVLLRKGLKSSMTGEIMALSKEHGIFVQFVPVEKLNRITGKNHQGVIALTSKISYHQLEQVLPSVFEKGEVPLFLVLDGITDIRNFGAIARSAECAGVHAIVIPQQGSAQVNEEAVRTSAGALLRVPVCRVQRLREAAAYMAESGIMLVGASEKGDEHYFDSDLTTPAAFIMGSEEKGISAELIELCGMLVKIPMKGEIASLNVSVAAGILLFEAVRQRMKA